MNPSASGWINKFGHLLRDRELVYTDFSELYQDLLAHGFIYGIHLSAPKFINPPHQLTEDEIAKINLLTALYFSFEFETGSKDFNSFVNTVFQYYEDLGVGKISFLNKILSGKKTEAQLEKLLDSRIYLNGSVFNKAMGNSLTNSLLYIDVLIFRAYLNQISPIIEHAQLLEYVTINIAYHSLNSKETNKNDAKLIQLLASSLTYVDLKKAHFDGSYIDLLRRNFSACEKDYLLDIACLTIWEDQSLDYTESEFIFGIGKDLGKAKNEVKTAIDNVTFFFKKNAANIPYLKDRHLASQFYEGMSKNVGKLILRNSKRLKRELAESKELMLLLSKSTVKDLTPEEKKKMQHQLLDIFKTIPSLAIFMLPGGAVLLPIFITLIPKLLPSAFDDNRIDEV
ncbi:MAG: LETM1-related biofilm-associated protein [Bacteroidota bacterium]